MSDYYRVDPTISELIMDANLIVDDSLRSGVVFRSYCPAFYQNRLRGDLQTFIKANNITLRIDLRSDDEISENSIEDLGISVEYLPIDPKRFFPEGIPNWDVIDIIKKVYKLLVFENTELLNDFVRIILSNPNATLVHCVAGRDRTGILIAKVQLLVGASVDCVLKGFCEIAGIERTEILGGYLQELVAEDGNGINKHAEKAKITQSQISLLKNRFCCL